jgi:hypothetical protein
MNATKRRKLKLLQAEAVSLMEFLVAEAYARGKDMHYRFRMPYGNISKDDGLEQQSEIVIDLSIYFDGELSDAQLNPDSPTVFKITGPDKGKH